ncbi:MAG: cytochrome c biogenesis protein CcsA [Desulfurococcales archaeon]|nr:cytochrome c biogenesis protein CcsA [Desulfurococcales archaeon]
MGIAIISWLVYVVPFIKEDYSLETVYETVHAGMPLIYKIASSWSTAGGSLVLFTGIIALSSVIYERRIAKPTEKLRFYVYSSALAVVGIILAIASKAYEVLDLTATTATGIGLNPLLKSPWVYPHPLSTFASYGMLVVAAAGVLAGLNSLQTLRIGWAILTLGILFGGYWSYLTLGWGGYWAWDPVEVSQLIPWLAAAAAIHAYPLSRALARALILMSAAGVYLSVFITRAGVSPLHGFATARGALVAITLTLTIGLLVIAFYVMLRSGREGLRVNTKKPYELGLLLSTISLMYMFIVTYFVLLAYSVLTMAGKIPGVPSGDEAIRVYHPLLAPAFLLLLAATPLAALGSRTGARQAYAVAGAGAILAGALAVATALGAIEWSSTSSAATNMLISAVVALGSVAAGSALAATLASIRVGQGVLAGIFLIHVLMGMLAVGIAVSGPYAYGSMYFESSRLKLGEEAQVGSIKIAIEDYSYELSEGFIEFYTPYAGRSLIYQVASYTTILMSTVLGDMIERALVGEEKLSEMNITLPASGVELKDIRLNNVSVTVVDPSQGINITLNGVDVDITNAKLYTTLTPTRGNITIIEYKISGDLTVDGMPPELENKTLMPNTRINIILNEPLNLSVQGFNVTVYNMTVSMFRLGGAGHAFAVVRESSLRADNITITLLGSLTRETEGGESIRIPYHLKDSNIVLYAYFTSNPRAKIIWDMVKSDPDIRKILSDKDTRYSILEDSLPKWCKSEEVLTAIRTQGNIPSHCIGYPPAPLTLHSGARLTLVMEIDLGSKVVTKDVTLRFEANGELQGIKGLVAASLPVATGILGNLYIEVYPSYVSIGGDEFGVHELELFYLHESLENLTTEEAIGVAAIFAAAALYSPDNPGMLVQRAMQDPLSLIIYTLELYQKAKLYGPENSTIMTDGILVRYKYIPAIYLVWVPATLMAAIELALAIIREFRRRAG